MSCVSSTDPADALPRLCGGVAAVEDAISAIEDKDPTLRCFVDVELAGARNGALASEARLAVNAALSALDGVPFAVKVNIACAGLRWTAGLRAREHLRADEDAAAVHDLRALGAVLVGTTNMAEAAVGATTDNLLHGICRNPLDPNRSAGGSSGGSAAAVAAGMATFALGSDTLGSVRIPAAYCAVAGWKPSRGLIDPRGLVPLCPDLDMIGLLAATSRQITAVATALGLIAPKHGSPRPRLIVLVDALTRDLDTEVRNGFEATLRTLHDLGYEVRFDGRAVPDLGRLRRALLLRCEIALAAYLAPVLDGPPEGISPQLETLLAFGRGTDDSTIAKAEGFIRDATRRLAEPLEEGLVVLPTTPHLPGPAGDPGPADAGDLTAWVNPLGACSVTVPTPNPGRNRTRLRPGVQIVGAPGADAAVLSVASDIESAP